MCCYSVSEVRCNFEGAYMGLLPCFPNSLQLLALVPYPIVMGHFPLCRRRFIYACAWLKFSSSLFLKRSLRTNRTDVAILCAMLWAVLVPSFSLSLSLAQSLTLALVIYVSKPFDPREASRVPGIA